MTDTLTFDRFTPAHLEGALRLSREAGWPHRMEDWRLVLQISQGVVALDGGDVVGTALATPFGPVAMANMIIVDARMRGRGLGRSLMDRMMAGVDVPEWRLVATVEGKPLYEKLGFRETGHILQHQGIVGRHAMPDGVEWASPADLPAIAALDKQATGADRGTLIARLMTEGRIAVIRTGATLTGFAALRAFGRGEVIGPVIADTLDAAQRLLSFFLAQRPGAFLRVDTTAAAGLAPWLTAQGLAPVGGGVAMRRGDATAASPSATVFALAAQALG